MGKVMDPLEVISSKFLNPAYLDCLFALLKVNCSCSQNGLKKKNKQKMINKIKLNVGKRSQPKAFISLSKSPFKKSYFGLKIIWQHILNLSSLFRKKKLWESCGIIVLLLMTFLPVLQNFQNIDNKWIFTRKLTQTSFKSLKST